MLRKSPLALAALVLALAGSAAAATPLTAQQPSAVTTTRFLVTVIRLKPEMVSEWMNLQRTEVIPAQKKAGVTSRIVLTTQVGNAFEYTTITPFPAWAAMDGPPPLNRALGDEGAATLNAKIRKCILTQQSYMTNRVEDLAIPADSATVWRTTVRRAAPGKTQEYLAFLRAEVLPTMKKAKADGKIAGYTVAVRGAGAMSGELSTVTYYAKFADMEAGDPLVQLLGQAAADKINTNGALLAPSVQTVIRRRIPDLSF